MLPNVSSVTKVVREHVSEGRSYGRGPLWKCSSHMRDLRLTVEKPGDIGGGGALGLAGQGRVLPVQHSLVPRRHDQHRRGR